jgi:outer membrane cobalamin receptor
LALRLRIGNLTDKDYQVVDGFNTYGRTAQLSLNYLF